MLELPDGKPNLFGLGTAPRQFRKKAVELGDRSVWTDTPADKERKAQVRIFYYSSDPIIFFYIFVICF